MKKAQDVVEKTLEAPAWDEISVVIMIAALAAYSVTWIVKAATKQKENKPSPWWLRLIAVGSGAMAGFAVGGWPWGLVAGVGAGSLTTAIVGFIKSKIKAKAEKLAE